MRAVLVDDEQMALDLFEKTLDKVGGVTVVGSYTNPQAAEEEIGRLQAEVVFLDIEMGKHHGLKVAERLLNEHPNLEIVFVTAYSEYALEAFEINAIDYLLKPVTSNRLEKTLDRIRVNLNQVKESMEQADLSEEPIYIQAMGGFRLFDTNRNEVKWRTRKTKELFVYLWHHQQKPVHRERVMDDLWQNLPKDKVAALMYTTVYQIRQTLKKIGIENSVLTVNEHYALNVEIESDVAKLKKKLSGEHSPIEDIMNLYEGDYLETEGYHWASSSQQDMKNRYLKFLDRHLTGKPVKPQDDKQAERVLQKMVSLEPYNERYTFLLLDHYRKTNNTAEFVTLYNEFKKRWREELGIDLTEEIVELYEKYVKGQ